MNRGHTRPKSRHQRLVVTPAPAHNELTPSASTSPPSNPAATLGRGSRAETGLTTLEWLLIVAAVAGIAALAVVLIQNVVNNTAESVAAHSARQEAAWVATEELTARWQAEKPTTQPDANELNRLYSHKCNQLAIIYRDIDLTPTPHDGDFFMHAYDQHLQLGDGDQGYLDLGPGWGPWNSDLPLCSL